MAIITTQEKSLLSLIAKGESSGTKDPYCALWPNQVEKTLVQMTLDQVQQFQSSRLAAGYRSTACGRYQFIRKTLAQAIKDSGLNPTTTLYTPDVQDLLILGILKKYRKMNQWLDGSLGSPDFQLQLSREFASVPVPYDTKGANRQVKKGESYYAGDRLNAAHGKADTFLASLTDIKNGGEGTKVTVNVSKSNATQPQGSLRKTQIELQAGGGQRVKGTAVGDVERPNAELPVSGNPYIYKPPLPLANRYDYRTGSKVNDILYNGTNPVANAGLTKNSSRPPLNDIGNQPMTDLQKTTLTTARMTETGDLTTKALTLNTPSGKKQIVKQFKKSITPAGQITETEVDNFNDIFSAAAGVSVPTINNVVSSPEFTSLAGSIDELAASLSSSEVLNSSLASLQSSLKSTFNPIVSTSSLLGQNNLSTATDLANNFGNNVSKNTVPGNLGGSLRDLASTFADNTVPSLQASLQQSLNITKPEFQKFAANLRNPALLNSLAGVSKDLQAAATSIATDPQVVNSIKGIGESLLRSLNVDLNRFPAEVTAPKVKRKPYAAEQQILFEVGSYFNGVVKTIQGKVE